MTTATATAHLPEFDEHGHVKHGHVIVSKLTLRIVLVSLVFFTLLTSGAAYLEEFISYTFQIDFPQYVNVIVALSIAAVKTSLVVLFFMQLKYDNPINATILLFTLIAVTLFLMLTMMDLGERTTIDFYKGSEIVDGGTGLKGMGPQAQVEREAFLQAHPNMVTHYEPPPEPQFSSPQMSRPVTGVTLGAYGGAPAEAGHGAPAEHH